jgi:NADP-dependent 3-hydroxy acid dehydrogenase YdfG
LLDARRLQLNGTGIRVPTVDPGLAETEFSVVRFKADVARAKRFTEAPVLSPPKTLLQKNAPLHI